MPCRGVTESLEQLIWGFSHPSQGEEEWSDLLQCGPNRSDCVRIHDTIMEVIQLLKVGDETLRSDP